MRQGLAVIALGLYVARAPRTSDERDPIAGAPGADMEQYNVAPSSGRCCVSGRELKPGEEIYSVVAETETGLKRWDYSAEHWTGVPEGTLACWHGRIPVDSRPREPAVASVPEMLDFFEQLSQSAESANDALRYVLTLWLVRRKALKLQSVVREGAREFLIVGRPRSGETFRVVDPELALNEIETIEQELLRSLYPAATAAKPARN